MTQTLGPCCICEGTANVRNVLLLNKKAPVPGHGWGCLVCDLAPDGAVAVLCDYCQDEYEAGNLELKFACRGYPEKDGRIPFKDLKGTHEHDEAKHDAHDN